jgi:hypothetical protein
MRPQLIALVLGAVLGLTTATQAGAAAADAPTAPGDLRVTAVTSRSVTLAWTASAPGCCPVAGYEITIVEAFNDAIRLQPVGDVTTVTVTSGIRPTGQYSFRVTARDTAGNRSAGSTGVGVVTPRADTGDTTPPSAPGGLTAEATPAGTTATWSPSTDDVAVTGYDLYRFDGLYISTLIATVTGTMHTFPPVTQRDMLYVRARDAAGNLSAASNIVTVLTPTPTPTPTPSCRVGYQVTARWGGGFVAEVTVRSDTAADGWVVTLRYGGDQRVTSAWNATASQAGAVVTLTAAHWNRVIPAGGSASAGLLGSWTTGPEQPAEATCQSWP